MKKYKLNVDLGIQKKGEVLEANDNGVIHYHYSNNHDYYIYPTEIILMLHCGMLEEVGDEREWKPKFDEKYWIINSAGEVLEEICCQLFIDEQLFAYGNCFQSRELAEEALAKVRLVLKETKKI